MASMARVWRSLPHPQPSHSQVRESTEQAALPHLLPGPGPGFCAPSRDPISPSHPRAHHICSLSARPPAPGKELRQPRCDDRQYAPYLEGECRPVLRLTGLVEPAPPGKGLSANSPLHHRGSLIPAPPRQEPTSAPPQGCSDPWGNPGGIIRCGGPGSASETLTPPGTICKLPSQTYKAAVPRCRRSTTL